MTMKEIWWKIRFVCKHWFKYCLFARKNIDFDGLSVEDFLLLHPNVTPNNMEHAFNDLMCHLCWEEPRSCGAVFPLCTMTGVTIYLKNEAPLLRSEHLIELSRVHGKTLQELCLLGRSNISREGFKQSFLNLQILETLYDNYAMDHGLLQLISKNETFSGSGMSILFERNQSKGKTSIINIA